MAKSRQSEGQNSDIVLPISKTAEQAFLTERRRLEKARVTAAANLQLFREAQKRAAREAAKWESELQALEKEHEKHAGSRFSAIRATRDHIYKLPRELIDLIYEFLYVLDEPLKMSRGWATGRSRNNFNPYNPHGDHHTEAPRLECARFPEDTSRFMNHFVVGKETAIDAAQVFYGRNTFNVANIKLLRPLFYHDHYNAGVNPGQLIQNLGIQVRVGYVCGYDHDNARDCNHGPPTNRHYLSSNLTSASELRHDLELLRDFPSLKELNISVAGQVRPGFGFSAEIRFDPRVVARTIAWLKIRNVKVHARMDPSELDMRSVFTKEGKIRLDISQWFDSPSDKERALYRQNLLGCEQDQTSVDSLEFPCLLPDPKCPRHGGRNCRAGRGWHPGWYRALIEDFLETERLMRANEELPDCLGCEHADEVHGQEVTMSAHVGDDFLNEDKGNDEILDKHFTT
ncbi:hypothetical protein FKW77_005930 [Venturia effusa]|uniref:Uncharacterized protein n=1 Tax=Venturia effusa TaxID=50376 RepID=A0A517LN03_9PEZI|nr:hypothetical protein FKW77_005930 [Venturia effusa]